MQDLEALGPPFRHCLVAQGPHCCLPLTLLGNVYSVTQLVFCPLCEKGLSRAFDGVSPELKTPRGSGGLLGDEGRGRSCPTG